MSAHLKVIWSEGMFLRPQHFQQHDRYYEGLIHRRGQSVHPYDWGFKELSIDVSQLAFGKFALGACQGLFPDGTPFDMPAGDELPPPVDIQEGTRDQIIYLCLPRRSPDQAEFDDRDQSHPLARYQSSEAELRDNLNLNGPEAPIEVGRLRTRLLLESAERGAYVCLGIARILEISASKAIQLDRRYIPPALNCIETGLLGGFLRELNGVFQARAESLAAVVTGVERMVAAEATHLLALQTLNRIQPLLSHLERSGQLHPEDFFRILVQAAGELSTFYRLPGRRPVDFPAYCHDDLQASFTPLMDELRQLLRVEVERHAFQIPLEQLGPGAYRAQRPDPILLETAVFVLAAKADLAPESWVPHFPNQVKIAPLEDIRNLINQALPGLLIRALPHVPQHIPRHAGFCYFELDKNSTLWKKLGASAGFGIHIGGNFPGLELEFWVTTKA